LGVIAAALLAGCSGDPAATTSPTTPSFSQTSLFDPTHRYVFRLSCSNAAPGSIADVSLSTFESLRPLVCGAFQIASGFVFFTYEIRVEDVFDPDPATFIEFCLGGSNTTGQFKCKPESKNHRRSGVLLTLILPSSSRLTPQ
jgi:hypothetical protein